MLLRLFGVLGLVCTIEGSASAAGPCEQPVVEEGLSEVVQEALLAFERDDIVAWEEGVAHSRAALRCVAVPIHPRTAALVHQLEASVAVEAGDEGAARRALQSMTEADPNHEVSPAFAPPGSDLARWLAETLTGNPDETPQPVALPDGVTLRVDGAPNSARPAARPAVLQPVTTQGQVVWTEWLPADATVPMIPADPLLTAALVRPPDSVPPIPQPTPRLRPRSLAIGAGAFAAVTGGLWVLSFHFRSTYTNYEPDSTGGEAELDTLQGMKRRWILAGAGAYASGAVAAGFGVTALTLTFTF